MAQESAGVPGARNGGSTASGLFQLLEAQREQFYPDGDSSVGKPIEEAEGGIRYILNRYGSVAAARRFWEIHHWY
ncbi:MAG: transglycosylase SLT domain-containing protein [Janthinobacterium lividum]